MARSSALLTAAHRLAWGACVDRGDGEMLRRPPFPLCARAVMKSQTF